MFPRPTLFCRVMIASFALTAVGRAAEGQLASRSPFLPPQSAGSAAPTQSAPLEFGGYIDTPGEGRLYRITVKDKDAARRVGGAPSNGAWVKLNERNPELDVTIKQHDESQKPATLTIEHQGKTITLAEKESKVVSGGAAAAAMPPPLQPPLPPVAVQNVPSAVTQSVVVNPTPQDEQKRLEAVAAEVARRRALREQAAPGATPAAVPQPAPQQTVPLVQPQAQPQQLRGYPQGVPVPANMPGTRTPPPNVQQPQRR